MLICWFPSVLCLFFFNDTATTEIYTLSLHDALPISGEAAKTRATRTATSPESGARRNGGQALSSTLALAVLSARSVSGEDRKSTRLNSSHANISYAVFCLKKKKKKNNRSIRPKDNY